MMVDGAIEIKLGANQIESAAENLKKIYEKWKKTLSQIITFCNDYCMWFI